MKINNVKTFIVDWNDYESVNKAFQKLKARKVDLDPSRISKKQRNEASFAACMAIWNSYQEIGNGYHYVYAHCDPERPLKPENSFAKFADSLGMSHMPFYIGKGCGDRGFLLNRNGEHRKIRQRIPRSGKEVMVNILIRSIDENSAFALESRLIDIFGIRTYGGSLVNLDEGQDQVSRRESYAEAFEILHKGVLGEFRR